MAAAGTAAGCGTSRTPWRVLTPEEARTLQAICDGILPEDRDLGAARVGVVHYIDRQLAGKFREHRKIYRDGIAAASRLAGGSFADAAERQPAVLRELERNPGTRAFFDLVVAHTMQGFYGDPRHGGNREFASWRMLALPPAPVRGRDRYELARGTNEKG